MNNDDKQTSIFVRSAKIDDAPGIHAVSKHLGYAPLTEDAARAQLAQLLHSKRDEVYLALSDGHVIAWLHLVYAQRLASASFHEIVGLVVAPNYRNMGVGRRLVAHSMAQHHGTLRVRCNALRTGSHEFYAKIGFSHNKTQHLFEKQI